MASGWRLTILRIIRTVEDLPLGVLPRNGFTAPVRTSSRRRLASADHAASAPSSAGPGSTLSRRASARSTRASSGNARASCRSFSAIGATNQFYSPRADVGTQDPDDLLAPLLQRVACLA